MSKIESSQPQNLNASSLLNGNNSKTILVRDHEGHDISFNVRDYGEGIPLLFIHGFPFDGSMWLRAVDFLLGGSGDNSDVVLPKSYGKRHPFLQYRAIIPDLRGLGKSELQITSKDTELCGVRMEEYADDLNELLTKLSVTQPVIVVGLSMGGYIAVQFASRYSKRVAGLVLCNTKTESDSQEAANKRRALMSQICSLCDDTNQVLESVANSMIPNLFASCTYWGKEDIVEEVRSMIVSNNPRGVYAATWGMVERRDTTDLLKNINVPMLGIGGSEDKFTPPEIIKKLTKIAQKSKYVEIPDTGHLPPMEQPKLFAITLNNFIAEIC
jgi:pimeloyl-ACP methyl ester carboxylesterase